MTVESRIQIQLYEWNLILRKGFTQNTFATWQLTGISSVISIAFVAFKHGKWICTVNTANLHASLEQHHQTKLDESTARRQLKSPQSLLGRSIHLTLVTKWSWSWSWMTYCHLLCAMSISPPILRFNYFKILPCKSMVKVICVVKGQRNIWPSKFKGQGHGQSQTRWSHLSPRVQSICLLFVSWQSDHFWLRYSKFYIWTWKI